MPKNLLQDMVREKRERRGIPSTPAVSKREEKVKEVKNHTPTHKPKSKSKIWILALVALVFLFFALSYLFSSANVTIVPKSKPVTLNENISASRETDSNNLPFDLVVISGEETQNTEATVAKDVSISARGKVVIYNNFSAASQNLDINTRLEGSNGKIYKTEKAIIVPGVKGSTPGSVEVVVYGEKGGDAYNSDPLDFKIFGFKGSPKYTKFYGRSSGPISGGLTGKFPYVPDSQKATVISDMKNTLETKLFKKADDQIPPGFILFKNGLTIEFDDGTVELSSAQGNTVPVKLKGTLYGILFDESKITKKIATENIKGYDGGDVYIQNLKDLKFSLLSKDSVSLSDAKNISFSLTGDTNIVYKFDTEKLLGELLAKPKGDFNKILSAYGNVDSAQVTLTPFWKMSFPDKTKDIHITVNYPQ